MILIVYKKANLALRVIGPEREVQLMVGEDSEYWPDKYPEHSEYGEAHGVLETLTTREAMHLLQIVDVTPQEAIAAIHGLGLPSEQGCDAEKLHELFEAHDIKVTLRPIRGAQRAVLDCLEFPNGKKLYLGACAKGAVAYRLTEAISYADRVES